MAGRTGTLATTGVIALVAAAALDVTGRLGAIGPARFTVYQVLAFAMILAAGWLLASGRLTLPRTPLTIPVLAFVAAAALAIIPAGDRGVALVQAVSLASSAALAALAVIFVRSPSQGTRVVLGTLGIAAVLGALAVLETAGIFAVHLPAIIGPAGEIRARATFADPNILASFLMTGALLAVPQLLWAPLGRRTRLLGWGGVALALAGLAATFSRGALGGLTIGLFCIVALMRAGGRTRRIFLAAVIIIALLVGAFVLTARVGGDAAADAANDASTMDRIYLAEGAVRMWLDHPFGVGPGNFPLEYPAYRNPEASVGLVESHTAYLTVLAELGWLGLLAFLWVLGRFFGRTTLPVARRASDGATRALAVGAGAAGLALCAQAFTYSLEGSKFLWLTIGLGAAALGLHAGTRHPRGHAVPGTTSAPVICHVTSVNIPTDGRILYHECRSLATRWRTVLVCRDDAPARTIEGVEILPIPRSGGRLQRWLSIGRLMRLAEGVHAELYHFHNIELVPTMARFALLTGIPVIYDAHEHHPDAMANKAYIPRFARPGVAALTERIERRHVPTFAAVVVADAALEKRYAAWSPRVVRLDNFPPLDLFDAAGSSVADPAAPILLYVGSLSEVRGYDDMLETIRLVRQDLPAAKLLLVGTPTDEVRPRLAALHDPAVIVKGPVPYGEIANVMRGATVGLSLLRNIPKFQKNVPTKVFDYMAASLPYVATDLTPVRELTGGVGGRLVPPGDPASAARAVLALLADPTAAREAALAGRRLIEERLNWAPLEARLFGLYEEILGAGPSEGESTP